MSYGSDWGSTGWGDGAQGEASVTFDIILLDTVAVADTAAPSLTLRVVSASAPSPFSVFINFSLPLDFGFAPLGDPANYSIPGLTVTGVNFVDVDTVLLDTIPEQDFILYTVTVAQAESVAGDPLGPDNSASFFGFIAEPSFFAGAQSPTKVEIVFSTGMEIDAAFTNPANYTLTAVTGSVPISILSVTPSGDEPLRRATLELGAELNSKEFYAIVVSSNVKSSAGLTITPDTYIFQWADMTRPLAGVPLEIPIRDFSGEVSGGLLGNPDGLVYFSPALTTVEHPSVLQVESVSVCTTAYDEYTIPDPPDPPILFTFRPGITATIGPGSVFWAPADKLGLIRFNLHLANADDILPPVFLDGALQSPISDSPVTAVLQEPIALSAGGFLNDARWVLGGSNNVALVEDMDVMLEQTITVSDSTVVDRITPSFTATLTGVVSTVFRVADNTSGIGPGTTTNFTFGYPDIRVLNSVSVGDETSFQDGTQLREADDTVDVTDNVQISGVPYEVVVSDSATVSESLTIQVDKTLGDTIDVEDALETEEISI